MDVIKENLRKAVKELCAVIENSEKHDLIIAAREIQDRYAIELENE